MNGSEGLILEDMMHKLIISLCVILVLLTGCSLNRGANNENTNNENASVGEITQIETPMPHDKNLNISNDSDWILIFEGEPIYENDLRFVAGIMGLTTGDAASRSIALNQLTEFLTIINRANRHGFGVTAEESEEILPAAQMNVEIMGLSGLISDERLVEFYAVGTLLSRLLDHYLTIDIISIDDHTREFEIFKEINRNFFANIQMKYIVNQDMFFLMEIRDKFITEGTANFDEIAREHSFFYTSDGGAIVYALSEFIQVFHLYDHDIQALFQLQTGDISHIFNIEDFFFIVYVINRTEASDTELEEAFLELMRAANRADSIEEIVKTWVESVSYTINQRVLDAMNE
jgi:hypothetical protein